METLLLIIIILASVLGVVVILSISSILFVQTKYKKLKQKNEDDMEADNNNNTKGLVHSASYVSHAIFNIKPPRVEDVEHYYRLEEALLKDPATTAKMAEGFHPHSMDETAHSLVVLFEAHDQAHSLLRQFIDLEMAKANEAEGPTTLFRRDSVASKMMRFYSKLIGQQYLVSVLWPNIRLVTLSDDFIELDRNRMKPEDDLDSHLVAFQEVLANFLEAIVNSIPLCPPQLREICFHLNARAIQHFPENNIKVLSGFIFLRFFTPAIISPHAYGIVEGELTPNQSRTLLLVAKVLQNMANGIPFGAKEQYMMPLNEFLTANTPLVRDFLTELSSEEPKIPLKAFSSVSNDSKYTAIRILHTNLVRSFPKFKKENYPEMYDRIQGILRELIDKEGKLNNTKTMRRVSVALLRSESNTTPEADFVPVQSVSLKAINVITPVVPATYNNPPTTPPGDSVFDPNFENYENFEDNGDNDDDVANDLREEFEDNENERNDRNERNFENEEYNETGREYEMGITKSASTIIASGLPSTPSPSSPVGLLSKSRSNNIISKSNNPPKKKKNKNIPNERLYRPNSSTKLNSPSSTSSFASTSSSSSNIRATSPMKSRTPSSQNVSTSPKPIRHVSPKKTRPAVQTKVSPKTARQNSTPSTSSPLSPTLSSLALKPQNNKDQFTQLPFPTPSPSSFSTSHY